MIGLVSVVVVVGAIVLEMDEFIVISLVVIIVGVFVCEMMLAIVDGKEGSIADGLLMVFDVVFVFDREYTYHTNHYWKKNN